MKNNNKILYISIAILVLAVGILIGTYAYYQTTISGTISGNVAKWSFKANGQTSSFNLDLGDLYPCGSGEDSCFVRAGITPEEARRELDDKIDDAIYSKPVAFVKKLQRRLKK